ncbi:MAG: nuclear transport factor 2 family protein [Pseudonocardiales bacterium]|nr:nuclear transport factor 2 family protein [Pseudonocardiales bacterium]
MDELTARAMIKQHFDWSGRDEVRASQLYAEDVVLEFPQGGERVRGRANIVAFRSAYPARLSFEMHRTTGRDDLWVNEYTIRYDEVNPHFVVGIMEFADDQVVRETIYLTQGWEPPAWRAQWVEPINPPCTP